MRAAFKPAPHFDRTRKTGAITAAIGMLLLDGSQLSALAAPMSWETPDGSSAAQAGRSGAGAFSSHASFSPNFAAGATAGSLPLQQATVNINPGHNVPTSAYSAGAHQAAATFFQQNAQLSHAIFSNIVNTAGQKLDLDLTSSSRDIVLGSAIFGGAPSINIDVSGATQTFHAGDVVTPAQYVAVQQVLLSGKQGIVLDGAGTATGGSFVMNAVQSGNITALLIPKDVTAVDYVSRNSVINFGGNLTNYGSINIIATNNRVTTGTIAAYDMTNGLGGVISSILPASELHEYGGVLNNNINLNLQATNNFTNAGTISNSGNLNLISGSGNFTNSGVITSTKQSINLSALDPATTINISNTGGTFSAVRGDINVRDASYTGAGNINIYGGDYLSRNLNLYSGQGIITGIVDKVDGHLNSTASLEHFAATKSDLTLGNNCVTGDPVFASIGNIFIAGVNTFAEDVAIISGGDITASSADASIVANGHNVTLIAGASFFSDGTVNGSGSSIPGSALNISGGSGTNNGTGSFFVTVDLTAPGSGNIDLSASNATYVIDTRSNTGNGGNVTLAAVASGGVGGKILTDSSAMINTSSTFSGANAGDVTILAGATSGGTTISTGNIIASARGTGTGGAVKIATQQPTVSGGLITYDQNGNVTIGGPIVGSGTTIANASISTGDIVTAGQGGSIASENGGNAGAITINAGNNITAGRVAAYGGGGAGAQYMSGNPQAAGNGGNGGAINITSGGAITLVEANSSGGGGGGGSAGGNPLYSAGGKAGTINISSTSTTSSVTVNGLIAAGDGGGGMTAFNGSGGAGSSFGGGGGGGANFWAGGGGGFGYEAGGGGGGGAVSNGSPPGTPGFGGGADATGQTKALGGAGGLGAGSGGLDGQTGSAVTGFGGDGGITLNSPFPNPKGGTSIAAGGQSSTTNVPGPGFGVTTGADVAISGGGVKVTGPIYGNSVSLVGIASSTGNISITGPVTATVSNTAVNGLNIESKGTGNVQLNSAVITATNTNILIAADNGAITTAANHQVLTDKQLNLVATKGIASAGFPLTTNAQLLSADGGTGVNASNVFVNDTAASATLTGANNGLTFNFRMTATDASIILGSSGKPVTINSSQVLLQAKGTGTISNGDAGSLISTGGAGSVILFSSKGDIGSSSNPINTDAVNLTLGTAASAFIADSATGDLLLNLPGAKNATISTAGLVINNGIINITGSLSLTATGLANALPISAASINLTGVSGKDFTLSNTGSISAISGFITIDSAVDKDVYIGNDGNPANIGSLNVSGTNNIVITANGSGAGSKNKISFNGYQNFNTDTKGAVVLNANKGTGQSVEVDGGAGNAIVVEGNNTVFVNSATLSLLNNGKLIGNPLVLNSGSGAGTITSTTDLDLSMTSNLQFHGSSLTIISNGSITASKNITIDLSGTSSLVAGGNGGNLNIIAGFNFTPGSDNQNPASGTFTLGTASSGGIISLGRATINTSSTVQDARGGNVLAVAAAANGTSGGLITLGNIDTSATAAGSTNSNGGTVTIMGQGIVVGNITTSGSTPGVVNIVSAVPTTSGTIVSKDGDLSGGIFVPGTSTGGNIQTGSISGGVINLTPGGAGNITTSAGSVISGAQLNINMGKGTVGSVAAPVAINVAELNVVGDATDTKAYFSALNNAVTINNITAGTFNLTAGTTGVVVTYGTATSSINIHDIVISTVGTLLVNTAGNGIVSLPDGSGAGGSIDITAAAISGGGNPITISADGAAGNGGSVAINTTANTGLTLGTGADQIKISAIGDNKGGSISLTTAGQLFINDDGNGNIDGVLNVTPTGSNTFGGQISLKADSFDWTSSATSALFITANGDFFGGQISINHTGASTLQTFGNKGGQISLTAVGDFGGKVSITTPGTLTFDDTNGAITAGLNVAPTDKQGDGGKIALTAGAIDWTSKGTNALQISADAVDGLGGSINLTLTKASSNLSIGSGVSDISLSATGVFGGTISATTLGTINITTDANGNANYVNGSAGTYGLNVAPNQGLGGYGGSILLSGTDIAWSTSSSKPLIFNVDGDQNGRAGFISVTQTGAKGIVVGNSAGQMSFSAKGSNNSALANGSGVAVASGGDLLVIDPTAINIAHSDGRLGGGVTLKSASATTFNYGLTTTKNLNGVRGLIDFGADATTAGSLTLINTAGSVTNSVAITKITNLTMTAGGAGSVIIGGNLGSSPTQSIILSTTGTGSITGSKTIILDSVGGLFSVSSAAGTIAPLTFTAGRVAANAPNSGITLTNKSTASTTLESVAGATSINTAITKGFSLTTVGGIDLETSINAGISVVLKSTSSKSTDIFLLNGNILASGKNATVTISSACTAGLGYTLASDISATKSVTISVAKDTAYLGSIGQILTPTSVSITTEAGILIAGNVSATTSITLKTGGLNGGIDVSGDMVTTSLTANVGTIALTTSNGNINFGTGADLGAGKSVTLSAPKGVIGVNAIGLGIGTNQTPVTVSLTAMDITNNGYVQALTSITEKATFVNGGITLNQHLQTVGAPTVGTITLSSAGSGGIIQAAGYNVSANKAVTMTSTKGNINLQGGVLAGGPIKISTSLKTAGNITVNNLYTANGAISVVAAGDNLNVASGASILANSTSKTTKATIVLQNKNTAATAKLDIGANADIETIGPMGSNITLAVGATTATNPNIPTVPGVTFNPSSPNPSKVFFLGTATGLVFDTNAGANPIAITSINQGKVVINGGKGTVTIHGGTGGNTTKIVADPPAYLLSAPTGPAVFNRGVQISAAVEGATVAVPVSDSLTVSAAPLSTNSLLSGLSASQLLATHSLLPVPVQSTYVGGGRADIGNRVSVIAPEQNTVIETSHGPLQVKAGAVVLLVDGPGGVSIFNMHDTTGGAVVLSVGGKKHVLTPGRHIHITNAATDRFELVNPAESFGYRNISSRAIDGGKRAFSSDFSLIHAIAAVGQLRQMANSPDPKVRRIADRLLKTAAIMNQVGASGGAYRQYPRPRITAMAGL